MESITQKRDIPIAGTWDVLVAGGGVAGICAAVAARRAGMRVLLLEKSVLLGGLATLGLISWYEPLCDGEGRQFIRGLAEELINLSIRYGPDTLPERWRAQGGEAREAGAPGMKARRYATFYSPTLFALALNDFLEQEQVDLRLDILAASPVMEGKRCLGIIAESKSGPEFFGAGMVVDTTGDADILSRAGVPCVLGKNYLTYVAHCCDAEQAARAAQEKNILHLRRWMNPGSDLLGTGHPQEYPRYAGVTCREVTDFVRTGQRLLFDKIKSQDRFARDVTTLPAMAQFRTTRRLEGAYVLTREDEMRAQDDSIGLTGDFAHPGLWYEIPWRCLYAPGFLNLLTAGRTISASGWAWDVTRVIPVAALTGQAAGTAAALCLRENMEPGRLDCRRLQQALEKQMIYLHHANL